MNIAEKLAQAFAAIRFTARPISDGMEYGGRIIGAAAGGDLVPNGARVLRFTIDATGRWLARVDGWGAVESDCDLRRFSRDAGGALREVAGEYWPAIKRALESARAESVRQSDACRFAAGVRKGAAGREAALWAAQHGVNALALSDMIDGPSDFIGDDEDLMLALAAE